MNTTPHRNSDPLPYVQVDRAVKPKATLLASALGVSPQHAIGSLVEFWDLCGDPRELEDIITKTPDGEKPEVVLDEADAKLRFQLASGKAVEVLVLVRLGLLEPRGDGYRVRGMSRYFEPIARRLAARKAASAAGKASAEARRQAVGSAQPRKPASEGSSMPRSTPPEAAPERRPNGSRTAPEPVSERLPKTADSGQRSADSGQEEKPSAGEPPVALSLELEVGGTPKRRPPPRPPKPETDPRHAPLVKSLCAAFAESQGSPYAFDGRQAKAVTALLAKAEPPEVEARWRRALRATFPLVRDLSDLVAKWNSFATDAAPGKGRIEVPIKPHGIGDLTHEL